MVMFGASTTGGPVVSLYVRRNACAHAEKFSCQPASYPVTSPVRGSVGAVSNPGQGVSLGQRLGNGNSRLVTPPWSHEPFRPFQLPPSIHLFPLTTRPSNGDSAAWPPSIGWRFANGNSILPLGCIQQRLLPDRALRRAARPSLCSQRTAHQPAIDRDDEPITSCLTLSVFAPWWSDARR